MYGTKTNNNYWEHLNPNRTAALFHGTPYYRLDNRNYDCDDIYMNDEHDAKVGCSSFSRNYFFGKRNCAYKGRTGRVNGKIKYYCDDGPRCRDRDD